jgi:hypothetical protein
MATEVFIYAFTAEKVTICLFKQNNSGVDLYDIRKVILRVEGTGIVGMDDIEFGN